MKLETRSTEGTGQALEALLLAHEAHQRTLSHLRGLCLESSNPQLVLWRAKLVAQEAGRVHGMFLEVVAGLIQEKGAADAH